MDVPTIERGAARLRALRDADSEAFFRWINDRATVVFNAPFAPVAREAHERWFAAIRQSPSVAIFAIEDAASGSLVGSCQLLNISVPNRSADLQIRIGEASARDRGIGSDAVAALVDFGLRTLGLHRIALTVRADNPRAIRAYEKNGFVREGLLKDAARIEDRWVDLVCMAVVAP